MLIIVEGPDGSGKSTLVKKLTELNYVEIKTIYRSNNEYNIWKVLLKELTNSSINYVMDRCFISEWIYRCLKKDVKPTLSLQDILNLCNNTNFKFVFCKNDNAYKNAKKRGETYITSKKEHDTLCKYYDFVNDTLCLFTECDVLVYDYTKDDVRKLL